MTLTLTGCDNRTNGAAPVKEQQETAIYDAGKAGPERASFTLSNGLEVLLISSPGFTKAAAAMAVPVGSWGDPLEHQGLAHFLEHMLFLGTKEFPNAGEYQQFISNNGGYANAYTSYELTNYHFEVNPSALPEALQRFSRFFVSPTLDQRYADKERNAVNSEFDKNILDEGWRAWFMFGQLTPKGHPHRKFNIGSKQTLANVDSKVLREFYEKYYSSNTMKLTLMSAAPLAELRALAETHFADIPNRKLKGIAAIPEPPKRRAGQWLEMKTLTETNTLRLAFPVPAFNKNWNSKPDVLVSALLGGQKDGSLASLLRRRHLANGVSANGFDFVDFGEKNSGYFLLDIDLSDKGAAQIESVMELTFSYIGELQRQGLKPYIFDERQTMARLAFENRGLVDGAQEAARYAAAMLSKPAMQIDQQSQLLFDYDPQTVQQYLKLLNPENVTVMRLHQKAVTDTKDPIYGIDYSLKDLPKELKTKLVEATKAPQPELAYPQPNPYIPADFTLFKNESADVPKILNQNLYGKVWFLQENGPRTKPLAYASIRLFTPEPAKSARNALLGLIYARAFAHSQTERLVPFVEADYKINVGVSASGVQIDVSGYSDNFAGVLKELVGSSKHKLNSIAISQADLDTLKESLAREFANVAQMGAMDRAAEVYKYFANSPSYRLEDYQDQLSSVTLEEFNSFVAHLFERTYVEALVYGNLRKKQIGGLVTWITASLGSQPLPTAEVEVLKGKESLLKPGQRFATTVTGENNNHAMYIKVDTAPRTYANVALNLIAGKLIEQEYYTEMRTNQQLGYIVWGGATTSREQTQLLFAIQSGEYPAGELVKRSDEFLAGFVTRGLEILDQSFPAIRDALVDEISRQPPVMPEYFAQLDSVFKTRDADWNYYPGIVSALRETKLTEAKQFFSNALDATKQGRFAVYYHADGTAAPTPAEGEVIVNSREEYESLR